MKVWNEFEYVIAYLDKNEMSVKYVRTNRENLGEQIEKIIDDGGIKIKVWRDNDV